MDGLNIKYGKEIGKSASRKFVWIACPNCGTRRWVALLKEKPVYLRCCKCAQAQKRGNCHWNWNGGRYKRKDGYIEVQLHPEDFFFPMAHHGTAGNSSVLEHRLVMAKYLGRCLLPWEVVHHKGTKYPLGSKEDKADNRIENLELLPHQRFHLVDLAVKRRIAQLEKRVTLLEAENMLLRSQDVYSRK